MLVRWIPLDPKPPVLVFLISLILLLKILPLVVVTNVLIPVEVEVVAVTTPAMVLLLIVKLFTPCKLIPLNPILLAATVEPIVFPSINQF